MEKLYVCEGTENPLGSGMSGDLLVTVSVQSHPTLTREGADLLTDAKVSMTTAALGGSVRVQTLTGDVDLKIPSEIATGAAVSLTGTRWRRCLRQERRLTGAVGCGNPEIFVSQAAEFVEGT